MTRFFTETNHIQGKMLLRVLAKKISQTEYSFSKRNTSPSVDVCIKNIPSL